MGKGLLAEGGKRLLQTLVTKKKREGESIPVKKDTEREKKTRLSPLQGGNGLQGNSIQRLGRGKPSNFSRKRGQ